MIQPLSRQIVSEHWDGTQTTKIPSNVEMMDKINELVHAYNRLEQSVNKVNHEITFNQLTGNLKRGIR